MPTTSVIPLKGMAAESIDSDQYVDGSIDNAHIADNAIDSEHYTDGSIDNAHIADNAIDSEHYADGSIDTAHIATNQIDETLMKDAFVADFTEVTVATGDSLLLGDATDSGNTKRDTVQGLLDLVSAGVSVKVGSFARAQAGASSDDSYTGIGFEPKVVIFFVYVGYGGNDQACFGYDDGTTAVSVSVLDYNAANAWYGDAGYSIWPPESASNRMIGEIDSMDADGFTIAWTLVGSPASTWVNVRYLAIG